MLPTTLSAAASNEISSYRVEFGEYLKLVGLPAFLFESGVLLAPLAVGILWAWRRARVVVP